MAVPKQKLKIKRVADYNCCNSQYDWDNSKIVFSDDFVDKALNRDHVREANRVNTLQKYHKNKK